MQTTVFAGSLLLFGLALPAAAQNPSFFPLETGNTWLFRGVTINPDKPGGLELIYKSIRVLKKEKIGEREYFNVSYFGRDVALRADASGDVLYYDREAGVEAPWASFSLPVGGTFSTAINPCPGEAQITSRDSNVAVPVGDFTDEIEVTFQASACADVGSTKQYYAPNVGLVRDEQTTLAGRIAYLLIYYRAGRASDGPWGEISFTMGLGSPWYFTDGLLGARLALRNLGEDPVRLQFPSGQSFELKIYNAAGEAVYTWSAGEKFTAEAREEVVGRGEIAFGVSAPLLGLPPGRYVAEGYLTTEPVTYLGRTPFEIIVPGKPGSEARRTLDLTRQTKAR
jgi:hypothetical protein